MNKTVHRLLIALYIVLGAFVFLFLGYNGFSYYTTPVEERFFLEQHQVLKPSGLWGYAFGVIGSLLMIFGVAIYMLRKRIRLFHRFGYLNYWLEFHIFLCLLGPIFILYHTSFKFGGIVAVSFWSMVIVVISGIAGRFIYIQIPRSISGQELTIKELDQINEGFNEKLGKVNSDYLNKIILAASTEKYKHITLSGSISLALKDVLTRRNLINELKANLNGTDFSLKEKKEILSAAKHKLIITRRIGLLRTSQKLFRYWHIFHLPFAITMFVIMVIHVVITFAMGSKWIF